MHLVPGAPTGTSLTCFVAAVAADVAAVVAGRSSQLTGVKVDNQTFTLLYWLLRLLHELDRLLQRLLQRLLRLLHSM